MCADADCTAAGMYSVKVSCDGLEGDVATGFSGTNGRLNDGLRARTGDDPSPPTGNDGDGDITIVSKDAGDFSKVPGVVCAVAGGSIAAEYVGSVGADDVTATTGAYDIAGAARLMGAGAVDSSFAGVAYAGAAEAICGAGAVYVGAAAGSTTSIGAAWVIIGAGAVYVGMDAGSATLTGTGTVLSAACFAGSFGSVAIARRKRHTIEIPMPPHVMQSTLRMTFAS